MPSRKPKNSRKRKHDEIQDSENEELSLDTIPQTKRRRITKRKSPTKSKQSTKSQTPRKSPRTGNHSKEEADSDSNSLSEHDQSVDSIDINESPSPSQRLLRNKNKKVKPLIPKRVSPRNKNKKQQKKAHRVSVSQSRTQSQRQSQRQSQSQNNDIQDFQLVEHNERVMEMYKWLTTSQSWVEIKKTLQTWVENESDSEDTENYAELTLDIINLILYCGGVRVFKLDDIDDLDLDALSAKEKEAFTGLLQDALMVDHEDIEPLPEDKESEDEEDEDAHQTEAHSEEEKAEEADDNHNTKKRKKKKMKKKRDEARTEAERVLDFAPMLWRNGSMKTQNSFKSRYGQLMQRIAQVFESLIFENDDYIMSCILNWCQFFARSFKVIQFRKLGTFTAFCLCEPLIRCVARNRKPMEKLREQLERETMAQRNMKRRGSPRKKERIKVKETEKMARFKENIEEYKNKIANLELHINEMFEKLAAYKAADNNDNIRCMVLENIVKWINIDPSTDSFLRDKYWQYLLYGLQDRNSGKVRETALLQLMELFDYEHKFHGNTRYKRRKKKGIKRGDNGNIIEETQADKLDGNRKAILEPFWDRIKGTVNSLLKDKNENVVAHCIEFINILLRADLLGPDDGDCILNYIFDESDSIRKMSAKFIFYDTFDAQAVLKSHTFDDERDEEKHDAETRIRIKDHIKMKDDIVEIIQLMKDRVIDLNIKVHQLLCAEKERVRDGEHKGAICKENALYRNYVQIADYIVLSMKGQLDVLREWKILFELLRDADMNEEREKERNITTNKSKSGDDDDGVEEMNVKHQIDDEGQTMLCYLILSCIKSVTNTLDSQCRNVVAKRGRKSKESEEEIRLEALDRLKECVLPHLSALLDTYQADVFKLYPLIKMIYLLPMEAFDGVENKQHLNQILNSLKTIFSRHDTPFMDDMKQMNDSESMDEDGDDEQLMITESMDDDEKEEIEFKIRKKELKALKICIKRVIDHELIAEIGKSLSFLCNCEYQHKEHSGRFVFDIVTQIIDEFEDITQQIDGELEKGEDLSTLDALMDDDGTKLNLMQSLYSNLHKQYSLACTMDVGPIQFSNAMQRLLGNIYDSLMFDGAKCQVSNMLYLLLTAEISRCVAKLNFVSPDMDKLHDLTQQKQGLAKVLRYYVDKMYGIIHGDENGTPNMATLHLLDVIASMMETLSYFKCLKHQHQLLDNTFNNASLIEMEPVYGIENGGNFNEISILKKRLFAICEYVLHLPMIEDPYDPSTHINTENIQIRYLFSCARLSIMNPSYYKEFGAIVLSFYYRPNTMNLSARCGKTRRDEIIKGIAHKLMQQNPEKFEEMLCCAMKMIMNNESIESEVVRKVIIEKIARSVAMMKGLGVNTRKSWAIFTKLMFDFIIGDTSNIPNYFGYLHCLTFFFRHFTNRDKLEIWSYFQSLSRKLPQNNLRNINDESKWHLYNEFREKLRKEAQKAQRKRNLDLNDDDLENLDLRETQTQIAQSQNVDINMSQSLSGSIGIGDINLSGSIDIVDINQSGSINIEMDPDRVAIAVSRIQINDNDDDDTKDEEAQNRVSVARPREGTETTDDDDNEEDEDEDVDLKDNEDEETEHVHREKSQISNVSSVRRGGLGNKKKKTLSADTKQTRKSPSGKWLKRKKNK